MVRGVSEARVLMAKEINKHWQGGMAPVKYYEVEEVEVWSQKILLDETIFVNR